MEYRLALTMNAEGDFFGLNAVTNLINTPSYDYVNPGLGQITRLYDLYTPIHANNAPFTIKKIDNDNDNNEQSEQAGKGVAEDIDEKSSDDSEQAAPNSSFPVAMNLEKSEIMPNENILKRKIDSGILESFQFPKIKVGKITLNSSNKTAQPKNSQKKGHKFSVI